MVKPGLNVAELEAELDKKKARLQELGGERERLAARIDEIDDEIHGIVGEGGSFSFSKKRRRRRVKNEQSLRSVVLEILKKNKKGFTLKDLEEKVLETGYKSHSANFRNVLYQCVYNTEGIQHNQSTGCYWAGPRNVISSP